MDLIKVKTLNRYKRPLINKLVIPKPDNKYIGLDLT